jgi:acetylornithine deacetylase/succinyl-diaminopimelate desuccinylase-like protein
VVTIPERAEVLVSRQIVPGENKAEVMAQMDAIVAGLNSPARIELTTPPPYYPPFEIAADHALVQALQAAFTQAHGRAGEYYYSTGVSDANLFAELAHIPTVLHGPTGANFHQCNEWVDLPSIVRCCQVFTQTIVTLLPAK